MNVLQTIRDKLVKHGVSAQEPAVNRLNLTTYDVEQTGEKCLHQNFAE